MKTRELIREDIRAWMRLWNPEAAARPKLPLRAALGLVYNYCGLRATILFRISHGLWRRKIPLLPNALMRLNLTLHGFDVPPSVPIGPGLYVPHPVGTALAARKIGKNVSLVALITVGIRERRQFPTIGDDVFVGAGARILGEITIGDGARIGANAVVLTDIPAGATAVGVPARPLPPKKAAQLAALEDAAGGGPAV
jgi:serine O-acetyltransferase